MTFRVPIVLALVLLAPLGLAGSDADAVGDVQARIGRAGQSIEAPPGTCHDGRVDLTTVDAAVDDSSFTFVLRVAQGDDEPACGAGDGTIALLGTRQAAAWMGWWGDDAFFEVFDSTQGCKVLGEFQVDDGLWFSHQFEAPCARSETADAITYEVGVVATVTDSEQDPVDLRGFSYGPSSASVYAHTKDASGLLEVSFFDWGAFDPPV